MLPWFIVLCGSEREFGLPMAELKRSIVGRWVMENQEVDDLTYAGASVRCIWWAP